MGEISVSLKYGSTSDVITIPSSCTLQQLLEIVEERTGVLTRKQKLICRGKILTALPASTSLTAAGIRPGDKLMLLAGAAESQGRAALRSSLKAKASALRERQTDRRAEDSAVAGPEAIEPRTAVWRTTGVASLRDLKLVTVPPQLYEAGESIRVADLGGNQLTSLPAGGLARLSCLQKLRLSLNRLEDGGMPWVALTELTSLIVLALDSNRLTSLHPSIGRLTRLQKLSVANNAVTDVPESIGNLTALRALCIRGNRIAPLPPSLGQCTMLEELDASNNPIEAIPEQLSSLKNLKVLLLDNTR